MATQRVLKQLQGQRVVAIDLEAQAFEQRPVGWLLAAKIEPDTAAVDHLVRSQSQPEWLPHHWWHIAIERLMEPLLEAAFD